MSPTTIAAIFFVILSTSVAPRAVDTNSFSQFAQLKRVYAVEVASFETIQQAVSVADTLSEDLDVWIESDTELGIHWVLLGDFALWVEAEITRDHLVSSDLTSGARLRIIRKDPDHLSLGTNLSTSLFNLTGQPLPSSANCQFTLPGREVIGEGGRVVSPLEDKTPREISASLLQGLLDGNLTAEQQGELMGYARICARQDRYEETIELALPFARGFPGVSVIDRCDAMMLCTRSHQAMGDRVAAFRGYSEMLSLNPPPADQSLMFWEQACLIWELAHEALGQGDFAECLVFIEDALPRIDTSDAEADRNHRRLGFLRIHAMSFMGRSDEVDAEFIAQGRTFVEQCQGVDGLEEEVMMAKYHTALALRRQGHDEECIQLLQEVYEEPHSVADTKRLHVAECLFGMAMWREDQESARQWLLAIRDHDETELQRLFRYHRADFYDKFGEHVPNAPVQDSQLFMGSGEWDSQRSPASSEQVFFP